MQTIENCTHLALILTRSYTELIEQLSDANNAVISQILSAMQLENFRVSFELISTANDANEAAPGKGQSATERVGTKLSTPDASHNNGNINNGEHNQEQSDEESSSFYPGFFSRFDGQSRDAYQDFFASQSMIDQRKETLNQKTMDIQGVEVGMGYFSSSVQAQPSSVMGDTETGESNNGKDTEEENGEELGMGFFSRMTGNNKSKQIKVGSNEPGSKNQNACSYPNASNDLSTMDKNRIV